MKLLRHAVLFLFCLPFNLLIGWPIVLFVRACWGTNLRWEIAPTSGGLPALTCDLKENSWPDLTWYARWGATTFGHAIFYGVRANRVAGEWNPIQAHEHFHVEQYEATMSAHALLGLLISGLSIVSEFAWAIGLGVWFLGYLTYCVGGWVGALLRGEPVYSGSEHEKAARALAGQPV